MQKADTPIQSGSSEPAVREREVLRNALIRLSKILHLSRIQMCAILGMSEASASRFFHGQRMINPHSKEGELALLLLHLYRSLAALLGSQEAPCRDWLHGYNTYFNAAPIEVIQRVQGLIDVINYLDAMRGKI
ncbi:MAG: MbcA/ParS/Xre antitoxin family protein [Gammaproteobacteria bacterium]